MIGMKNTQWSKSLVRVSFLLILFLNIVFALNRTALAQITIADLLEEASRTPTHAEVASVIASVCPGGSANADLQRDCNAVVGAALDGDPATGAALNWVTPDGGSSAVDVSQTALGAQTGTIAARLAALRKGTVGVDVSGLAFAEDVDRVRAANLAAMYTNQETGGAAGDESSIFSRGKLGMFVSGIVGDGDKSDTAREDGFLYDTKGMTMGLDYRLSERAVFGAAVGLSARETEIKFEGGGLDSDGLNFTLYGSYSPKDAMYLDASISYGRSQFDQVRPIRYALANGIAVDQIATADYDGNQFAATLGGGFEITRGNLSITPLVQLQYLKADVDGFTETMSSPTARGSGWALAVDGQTFTSTALTAGVQMSLTSSQSWGVVIPQVRAVWVHEFQGEGEPLRGRFLADSSGQEFALELDEPDRNYAEVGLGASALFANGRSGFIYFEKVLGYENVDSYSLAAGFRMEF